MSQHHLKDDSDSISTAHSLFAKAREELIANEKSLRSDHKFCSNLSPTAQKACTIVSKIRAEERKTIWSTTSSPDLQKTEIFPGMMFNIAKEYMETTKLWKIVLKMPKGALLHCHLGAMVDLHWVFNAALSEKGMCISATEPLSSPDVREKAGIKFAFSKTPHENGCSIWSEKYEPNTFVPVTVAADSYPDGGRGGWVRWMKDRCSITQSESLDHHLGIDDVWRKLNAAFAIVPGIVYYEPVMRKFLREFFRTLLKDGVRWVKFRTAPFTRFVLEGQEEACSDPSGVMRAIAEEIEGFKRNMRECIRLKKDYPDVISGYDLVGHEDSGRTLRSLTPELLWFQSECRQQQVNIPFFFHAGECVGDGDETDENLFDAILFGTRRLGHAFSLYKHPTLIDLVKQKSILVESCPISNEVLRYTASIMSHPLPALLARGVPAALSNDDPALLGQGTSGMTHDFWQALQGWENLGLEGLGSLAQNSVRWSAFEDEGAEEWEVNTREGEDGSGIRADRIKAWNAE
ncbi:Adenosine deaminase 2-A, partial [Lachnellula arida]